MGPGETALPEGSVQPWVPQSGSRHPVETGAEAWGMDAPHQGNGADLKEVWSSPGGLLCISRDLTMSPLVLSDSSSSTPFLRGIRRMRPPVCPRMPTWDLAVVLEALSKAPFEPLEEVPLRFHTVKTVFLLAISSLKRVNDL